MCERKRERESFVRVSGKSVVFNEKVRALGKTSFKLRASEKNTSKATIKLYTNRVCVITFQLMYFKFPK